jgi:hypothetical protein
VPIPCGGWQQSAWLTEGAITWQNDATGVPQPSISDATERCEWSDACAGTTREPKEHTVSYEQTRLEDVSDEDGLWREVGYTARSTCGGADSIVSDRIRLARTWSATWADANNATRGGLAQAVDENGNWSEDGRMAAPQDQAVPPEQRTAVTVAPNASIQCEVEEAHDFDRWSAAGGRSGSEADSVSYAWSASGGTFTTATSERSATWQAPSQAGTYTLSCSIDDGGVLPQGDAGSRDDAPALVRSVEVMVAEAPSLVWGGELVGGQDLNEDGVPDSPKYVRACAGGVDDHTATDHQYRAHTRQITATVKRDGAIEASAAITFRFLNNVGHDYGNDANGQPIPKQTARFWDAASQSWKEEVTLSSDANDLITFWVKSSDVISDMGLVAVWKDAANNNAEVEAGSIGCEWGTDISYRRFDNEDDPDEVTDTGWLFQFPKLSAPDEMVPAKVYLKFMIDPANGDKAGNWQYVNGHQLQIEIGQIALRNGQVIDGEPTALKDYAFVINPQDAQAVTMTLATGLIANGEGRYDGAAQVMVKAGPQIQEVLTVLIGAFDLTQVPY